MLEVHQKSIKTTRKGHRGEKKTKERIGFKKIEWKLPTKDCREAGSHVKIPQIPFLLFAYYFPSVSWAFNWFFHSRINQIGANFAVTLKSKLETLEKSLKHEQSTAASEKRRQDENSGVPGKCLLIEWLKLTSRVVWIILQSRNQKSFKSQKSSRSQKFSFFLSRTS